VHAAEKSRCSSKKGKLESQDYSSFQAYSNMDRPKDCTPTTQKGNKHMQNTNSEERDVSSSKNTGKYKRMPSRKGKYNEPYHDGLYRFQD